MSPPSSLADDAERVRQLIARETSAMRRLRASWTHECSIRSGHAHVRWQCNARMAATVCQFTASMLLRVTWHDAGRAGAGMLTVQNIKSGFVHDARAGPNDWAHVTHWYIDYGPEASATSFRGELQDAD